jgi:hypothetical protein
MEQTPNMPQDVAPSSFMTRTVNVFTSPGELFTELKSAPVQKSSWLIPYIVILLLAVLATYAVYTNPELRQQIYDIQERAMKEQVAAGKMTQQQSEQFINGMESSGPVLFIIIGAGSQILGLSCFFFGFALILMLILKFGFKATAGYGKILEALGLVSFIGILGTIITILLMNVFNTIYATPGPALAVINTFDPLKTGDRLLASINIFTIWEVGLLGSAVSKLSGKSTGAGLALMYGLWLVWVLITVLTGFGMK